MDVSEEELKENIENEAKKAEKKEFIERLIGKVVYIKEAKGLNLERREKFIIHRQ